MKTGNLNFGKIMLPNFAMMDFVYEQIYFNLGMQPTITHFETFMHHPEMPRIITRSERLIHRPNTKVIRNFYDNFIANRMASLALQPFTWNYNQNYNANTAMRGYFANPYVNETINQSMQPLPTGSTSAFNHNANAAVENSFDENSVDDNTFDPFYELEDEYNSDSQELLEKIKEYADSLRYGPKNYSAAKSKDDTQVVSDHVKIGNQMNNSVEDNRRQTQVNDVILRNIPYNQKEKLLDMFAQIAEAVGFEYSIYTSLNTIFRLSSDNKNGAPILVRFVSLILKRKFMINFHRKRPQLKDIALIAATSTTCMNRRIFARENLTPLNHAIYLKAAKLVRDKQLCNFRTNLGFVHVMYPNSNEWTKIIDPDSLPEPSIEFEFNKSK